MAVPKYWYNWRWIGVSWNSSTLRLNLRFTLEKPLTISLLSRSLTKTQMLFINCSCVAWLTISSTTSTSLSARIKLRTVPCNAQRRLKSNGSVKWKKGIPFCFVWFKNAKMSSSMSDIKHILVGLRVKNSVMMKLGKEALTRCDSKYKRNEIW